MLKRQ